MLSFIYLFFYLLIYLNIIFLAYWVKKIIIMMRRFQALYPLPSFEMIKPEWIAFFDKSPQKALLYFSPLLPQKKDTANFFFPFFQTWRWTLRVTPPPQSIDALFFSSRVKSPRYKSESWKAGQRREREYMPGPSILIQKFGGKRERKVWTKGTERHKRRWIIQCTPLLDSFVILYNGQLENNQLIAWKRSLTLFFPVTPGVNVLRRMSQFGCKYLWCPYGWSVNPAGWK